MGRVAGVTQDIMAESALPSALGADRYAEWQRLDIGDLVRLKHGFSDSAISVKTSGYVLLAKAFRPLPENILGSSTGAVIVSVLDLIAIRTSDTFEKRSDYSHPPPEYGCQWFYRVETPILHQIPGGAAARPLSHITMRWTWIFFSALLPSCTSNSGLIVGGFERVYGDHDRRFRKRGLSIKHNRNSPCLELYRRNILPFYDAIDLDRATDRSPAPRGSG